MQVIIASDNQSTRGAIAMLVRVQPDLELVGEVDDLADLLVKIKAAQTPLVLLDWDAFGHPMETLAVMQQHLGELPSIIALSVREEMRTDVHAAGIRQRGEQHADHYRCRWQ